MAIIRPETYSKFKPIFLDAVNTRTKPGAVRNEMMQAISDQLAEASYGGEDAGDIGPYIDLFLEEVSNGTIDPFPNGPYLAGLEPSPAPVFSPYQKDLFARKPAQTETQERALLDQLIAATRLYDSSEAIQELLAFSIRLREFAPFNAMLLHIQKPGLTYAATAQDWRDRFGRAPKRSARPLLVLRTMGPVDFVFDVLDTEGRELPVDAFSFPTFGNLSANRFGEFMRAVAKDKIDLVQFDAGDSSAGWIRLLASSGSGKGKNLYQLAYNRNHPPPTRFVTVAH